VTGASAGIGAEFCRQLAARGYGLVLVARRAQQLRALADELQQQFGSPSHITVLDLSRPGACSALADELEAAGIEVEFLVNNAGFGLPGHFTDAAWESHQGFIQLMMTAVCELTWRLLPAMQKQRKGYIVNVASLAGLVPSSAGHTLYGASKAFLVRFSESLALENHAFGVRVSALCPGFTYSEFHDVTGTRELVSRLPSWMWMGAAEVVACGIDAVTGKKLQSVAIPGRVNRLIAGLVRYAPGTLLRWMNLRMSKRYRAQKAAN
jgi:short-subunit dehydrogenase